MPYRYEFIIPERALHGIEAERTYLGITARYRYVLKG